MNHQSLCGMTLCLFATTAPAFAVEPRWQPEKTRAFIVCLAQFSGDKLDSFSTDDRLDGSLVQLLIQRGIPKDQIVFLSDKRATTQNIKREFTSFLRKSKEGEMLFFYFGSHGGYDPNTGVCEFFTFDDELPFQWVFDAIDRDFKGTRAFLTADCCHSGGIVELAQRRTSRVAYACLSSTYTHQTAWSGWRFVFCLLRGFSGDPVVDLNNDGHVDVAEFANYTERYMSFAAEGKPMFCTTHGFNPQMILADTHGKKADSHIGDLVEVKSGKKWYKAEVLSVKGKKFKIHYTADTKSDDDEWVTQDQIRPYQFQHFRVGSDVEVKGASSGKWYPARVLDTWGSMHFCRYDGYSPAYDEWVGPSRIRR